MTARSDFGSRALPIERCQSGRVAASGHEDGPVLAQGERSHSRYGWGRLGRHQPHMGQEQIATDCLLRRGNKQEYRLLLCRWVGSLTVDFVVSRRRFW